MELSKKTDDLEDDEDIDSEDISNMVLKDADEDDTSTDYSKISNVKDIVDLDDMGE
ncbi:MAG: hypothetical protein GX584_05460, partial [Clostridiaceae bacterium]|nr:hypothetical protein [Clostridiaceae bacterium]